MFRTQALFGLMLAGFMGSAAAVGPGYLGNLSGQSFSIGNSFGPLSTIHDIYTFDILPFSVAAGTAVTVNLDSPLFAGVEFALSNFGVEFRNSADALIASDFQTSPTDYTVEIAANLAAGNGYRFIVRGDVAGTMGGSYGGVLAAAPIPEAETYLMLLAGLGLVGMMVVRSRRSMY